MRDNTSTRLRWWHIIPAILLGDIAATAVNVTALLGLGLLLAPAQQMSVMLSSPFVLILAFFIGALVLGALPSIFFVWPLLRRQQTLAFAMLLGAANGMCVIAIFLGLIVLLTIRTGTLPLYWREFIDARLFIAVLPGAAGGAAAWSYLTWIRKRHPAATAIDFEALE